MEIGFRRLHTQWPGRRDQLSASTPSNSKQPMSTASIGKGRWTPALTEQTGMVQVQPAATWDLLGSRNCVNTKQQQRNLREPVHYQTILLKQKKKKKKMQEGNTNSFKTSISPYRQHHKSFNSSLWILPLHSRFNPQTVLSAQFKNQGIEQRNELKRMVDFFFFFLKIRTRHYNF